MSENETQADRNWSFQVDLSGVRAPTGGGALLPEGYYIGTIKDMYIQPEKPGRVIIKVMVTEGEFANVTRTDGLNVPTSDEDKVRHYWRALAEGVGYGPNELDKGSLNLGPKAFVNRTAYFKYTPKEEGVEGREYDRLLYLAKGEWDTQRMAFAANGGVARAPMGKPAAKPAVETAIVTGGGTLGGGGGTGGTTSKDAVLSKLGLGGQGGGNTLGNA